MVFAQPLFEVSVMRIVVSYFAAPCRATLASRAIKVADMTIWRIADDVFDVFSGRGKEVSAHRTTSGAADRHEATPVAMCAR